MLILVRHGESTGNADGLLLGRIDAPLDVYKRQAHADPDALPPYVERIRLDRVRRDDPELVGRVVGLARSHLARRPLDNPVTRMAARLREDLPWLATQDIEAFHLYSCLLYTSRCV